MASASSYTTQDTRDIFSLRAAALLTLRSRPKPRLLTRPASIDTPNPDDTSSIASPRKVAPSPELDYGSDDASPNEISVSADEAKKAGEKEEGEISDDEGQRVTKPAFSMMDIDNEPLPGLTSILDRETKVSVLPTQGNGVGPSSSSQSDPSVIKPSSQLSTWPRVSHSRSLFINEVDSEHVRPSLKMTAQELAEAKEIILDLLGWNVPPEYLLNCGLTKEAIYYVFTELNLKLPGNIDFRGILPYVSPKETEVPSPSTAAHVVRDSLPTPVSETGTVLLEHSSPSLSPTTAQIYALTPMDKLQTSKSSSVADMYVDPIPGLRSRSIPLSTPSQPSSPTIAGNGSPAGRPVANVPKHGYSGNLDEIETQRRQELLARKAALASRRKLETKEPTASLSSTRASLETPTVPSEVVDNFLNSIVSATPTVSVSNPVVDVVMEDSSPECLASPVDISVTSLERHVLPTSKKSTNKRAVAADWIDHEFSPRNNSHLSLNGNSRPINIQRPSSASIPSFANLQPNRKVVIDFSDSEDELSESLFNPNQAPAVTVVKTTLQTTKTSSSEATNVTTIVHHPKHLPAPDILLLKEQEIKRMKELIAERERTKSKALSKPPQSVTPPPALASPVVSVTCSSTPPEIGVGVEDFDRSIKQEPDRTPSLSLLDKDDDQRLSTRNLDEDSDMKDSFDLGQTGAVPTDLSSSGTPAVEVTHSLAAVTPKHEHEPNNEQLIPPLPHFPSNASPSASQVDTISSSKAYFTDYISPLSIFPVAEDRPISNQISQLLRPLRYEIVSRLDPMQTLCPFEIPGGGKCQDSTCTHVHLRDFEPTDDETAQYLTKILASTPQLSFQMIRTALSRVRASKQEMNLNSRVLQALDHLGVR